MGVKTIVVATGDFSKVELNHAGADFILDDLKETKTVLGIILNDHD